ARVGAGGKVVAGQHPDEHRAVDGQGVVIDKTLHRGEPAAVVPAASVGTSADGGEGHCRQHHGNDDKGGGRFRKWQGVGSHAPSLAAFFGVRRFNAAFFLLGAKPKESGALTPHSKKPPQSTCIATFGKDEPRVHGVCAV